MRILVIGESCKDVFHYGICRRLCPEAPVPVFNSVGFVENGGMAMNVYNNIKALGANVEICTNKNWSNIIKTRFVEKRSNHMFMRLDENDDQYSKCNIDQVDFSLFDAVVVSDYNKGFLDEQLMYNISLMHPLTFLDTKRLFGKWCDRFSFIKINNVEHDNNKSFITDNIKSKLIVTKGPMGCLYRGKLYPVPVVEIKDTSGAGDTFISGLCVKYCLTGNIEESIKFANECSTKAVQKLGVAVI